MPIMLVPLRMWCLGVLTCRRGQVVRSSRAMLHAASVLKKDMRNWFALSLSSAS
jgi:hypothetical protein